MDVDAVGTGDREQLAERGGEISGTGVDAMAARLSGNITGALVVQGNLTATGFDVERRPGFAGKREMLCGVRRPA